MATLAHCAYCFESLAASFEHRRPLGLAQVEDLWFEYKVDEDGSETMVDEDSLKVKPATISRLLNPSSSSSSTSSLASSRRGPSASSTPVSNSSNPSQEDSHPLFITWNTLSKSGNKSLRGCIGTFEPQPLSRGLQEYSHTAAFEDHRFSPIPVSLLPSLQVCVTLLTNFSKPDKDVLNWTIGEHGIRLSFHDKGRRYSATYLPDVALEQGWTKEEAIMSLMRKAGWMGKKDEWRKTLNLEIVRYEGKKVSLDYASWKEWRDWVEGNA